MLKAAALAILVIMAIVIVIGIVIIHNLPGKVAKRRNHPQAEAIHICSLVGLLLFPFWMIALVWAYIKMPTMRTTHLDKRSKIALSTKHKKHQS